MKGNTLIPRKAQNVQTVQPDQLSKRSSSLLERKQGLTGSLPFGPSFTTSACHFNFSHHTPLLYFYSPSGVREKLSLSCQQASRAISPSHQASYISWYNTSRAMWQLEATLASSQSSRKGHLFALQNLPDNIQREAFYSVLAKTGRRKAFTLNHDSPSLSHTKLLAQPYHHISPQSGD